MTLDRLNLLTSTSSDVEIATMRKVAWRLLPVLMLGYFIAFIDRVNVGFAALQMNQDIGLNATQFGLGGGLFYLTYVLLEIPSNLVLQKVGARWWIARIMVSWGLVSACTAWVSGPSTFYAMRLLLGAAEAGFFPGVILYLTYWFPAAYRARIVAIFMVAIPLSSFVGSPLSASLLQLNGWLGLKGWQAMFILEGAPALVLGMLTPLLLTDQPANVKWLQPHEKDWLIERLASEAASRGATQDHVPLRQILTNPYVLAAAFVYAGASGASQVLSLWQPQIIQAFGLSTIDTGLLNSIPFGVASGRACHAYRHPACGRGAESLFGRICWPFFDVYHHPAGNCSLCHLHLQGTFLGLGQSVDVRCCCSGRFGAGQCDWQFGWFRRVGPFGGDQGSYRELFHGAATDSGHFCAGVPDFVAHFQSLKSLRLFSNKNERCDHDSTPNRTTRSTTGLDSGFTTTVWQQLFDSFGRSRTTRAR